VKNAAQAAALLAFCRVCLAIKKIACCPDNRAGERLSIEDDSCRRAGPRADKGLFRNGIPACAESRASGEGKRPGSDLHCSDPQFVGVSSASAHDIEQARFHDNSVPVEKLAKRRLIRAL
jgi:hypothetical protein